MTKTYIKKILFELTFTVSSFSVSVAYLIWCFFSDTKSPALHNIWGGRGKCN